MTVGSYILGIVSALAAFLLVLEMLRRRRIRERHAVWWMVGTILALIVSIFPNLLTLLSDAIGVTLPINLVFFLSIGILVLVCLQHAAELTQVEAHTRSLTERVVLQDLRISELERRLSDTYGD
ncbi:MAG: DUF2304 domain-containing protein [Mycetocola sp.]